MKTEYRKRKSTRDIHKSFKTHAVKGWMKCSVLYNREDVKTFNRLISDNLLVVSKATQAKISLVYFCLSIIKKRIYRWII